MGKKQRMHKDCRWILGIVLIVCLIMTYGWWNGRMAYGYETSNPSESRTFSKGYFDVIIKGPSGQEWINGEVNYSGKQMTQDDFNNASRTLTFNRKSGEAAGVYNAKITTTSAKTIQNNSKGNYTRFEFNIQYTQPAHQVYSSESADNVTHLGSDYKKASSNFSSQAGHSTSARTVNVKINMSIYATGVCTYKINNKFQRVWNTAITLNLKKNNYTLSYNANGGSVSTASKTVACGGTYGTLPSAWRTGYSLKGWNNQSNGSGSWANSSWVVCSGNHTVYAIWTPKQYTIAYDGNGADSGSMQSTTATYDANVTLAGNGFTKKGYAFLGWSTDENATSAAYTNGQTFPWKQDGNMTLYAVWSKDNYEVELYGNGASGEKRTETIKYGQASALPKNKFERSGYTFLGWSTKEDALLPEYTDEQAVTNLCDAGDTCSLYAVWKKTDGSFDLTNIIHDEGMFNGSVELKGQNGTEFLREWIDSTYARIDKPNTPGYFSSRY